VLPAQYPDISVELSCLDRKIDLIGDGFDLVIRIGHLDDSSLVARKLGNCPRVTVASPSYIKKHGVPRKLNDLKQHNCLIFNLLVTVNIWHFLHKGKQVSVQVNGNMRSNSSDAIVENVLSGLGIAVIPNWLIQPLLDSGELVGIMDDYVPMEFPINALYPQNHYIPLKVRCFVNFLKEQFSQLPIFSI